MSFLTSTEIVVNNSIRPMHSSKEMSFYFADTYNDSKGSDYNVGYFNIEWKLYSLRDFMEN